MSHDDSYFEENVVLVPRPGGEPWLTVWEELDDERNNQWMSIEEIQTLRLYVGGESSFTAED